VASPISRNMSKNQPSRVNKILSIPRLTQDHYVFVGGEQYGPFKIAKLWEFYFEGRIYDNDFYWTKGYDEWQPIPKLYHSRGSPFCLPGEQPCRTRIVLPPRTEFKRDKEVARSTPPHKPKAKSPFPQTAMSSCRRCTQCHGPALPRFFFCSQGKCGLFCRLCMNEIVSSNDKCPICGGPIKAVK